MIAKKGYVLLSESAIDALISSRAVRSIASLSEDFLSARRTEISADITAYATGRELDDEFCALIDRQSLESVNGALDVIFTRIARVLKSATRPPVHLPRSWAEFHFKSRLSFFATGESDGDQRWLADIDGSARVVKFLGLTGSKAKLNLAEWQPPVVADFLPAYRAWVVVIKSQTEEVDLAPSFSEQVDLKAIGSEAVVQGFSYDSWIHKLKPEQLKVVESSLGSSVRVIGPAGSGKTLTLCMRALRIARDAAVIGERKKILVVTHSWAMAERIDGILSSLAEGHVPSSISVMPLLYILQNHAGSVGQMANSVLGEDSAEGQRRVIDLLDRILEEQGFKLTSSNKQHMSPYVVKGVESSSGSHARNEFVIDLYEEIIGILSPQGIMPGDSDKIADYLISERDETLPPFVTKADRELCLRVFERLLEQLIDLGAITTDQLVLDCIRVFETFTWNVKRETDGYDFILIDELQLFDSQERLAVSLLSRSKPGMVFLSVEDPSQGMFSVVNERSAALRSKDNVYLEETHRFRAGLFEFINYLYNRFPLNAAPIRYSHSDQKARRPKLWQLGSNELGSWCVARAREVSSSKEKERRICFVCVAPQEDVIAEALLRQGDLAVVQLKSFDDVELLSYQRRAAVVSSWQFIGGTQFSDVVLVVSGLTRPTTAHAKLRELTAIYLGASRASSSLDIVCDARVPDVIQMASRLKLVNK